MIQQRKDILAAANYLETYGWQRSSYGLDGGPRCVVGALRSVTGYDYEYHHNWPNESAVLAVQTTAAISFLRKRLGVLSVLEWNDSQPDCAAVVAKLREVAAETQNP